MCFQKISIISNLITTIFLKTLIIYESTFHPSQFECMVLILLNQLQTLKYIILPNQMLDNQITTTSIYFIQQIFRPYLYFWEKNQLLTYFILALSLALIFFCAWTILLLSDFHKENQKNFIISLKNFQQRSTLSKLLANTFKFFILIKSQFLGYIILESAFFSFFNINNEQIFHIIGATFLAVEIILIFFVYEYLLCLSLDYQPKYSLKCIQYSNQLFFIKVVQICQMIIYSSNNPLNKEIQLAICIFLGLFQLFTFSGSSIFADNKINNIIKFSSCVFISSSVEQILNLRLIKTYQSQQLWILLTLLLFRIFSYYEIPIILHKICKETDDNFKQLPLNYFKIQKANYIQILKTQLNTNSKGQIHRALFLVLYNQKSKDMQSHNSNDQHLFQKIDHLSLKQTIYELNTQILYSKLQSAELYFDYCQLLFLTQNYLLILNYCMKIVNQVENTAQNKNRVVYIIKNQVSFKFHIYFQYFLQLVQYQLSLGFKKNNFEEDDIIKRAIQMTQLKLQQQKSIHELLEKSVKIKTNIILEIFLKQREDFEIETIFINSVKEMLSIKSEMERFCLRTYVSGNHCLLMFFYLEILNDLISSQQISSMQANYFGLEERMHDFLKISEQLQNQFSCLKFSIQDEDQIALEKVYLNKSQKNQMSDYLSFYQMIPESISEIHKYYIRHFFQTGKNKFHSQINVSFVSIRPGIISPIEMCMDILFDINLKNLQAVTFIREISEQQLYIFVDRELKIKEVSSDFYQKILNYPINKRMILKEQDITFYVPQLKTIDWNHFIEIKECQFNFPSYGLMSGDLSHSSCSPLSFTGTIQIESRYIGKKIHHYLLKILDINIPLVQYVPEKLRFVNVMDESEKIDHPFDFHQEIEMPKHIYYSSRIDTLKPLLSPEIQIQNISQNSEVTENQIQIKKEVFDDNDGGDACSQQSSISLVKISTFYKQFLMIKKLISSKIFPKYIYKFNIFYSISIILITIHIILLLLESQTLEHFLKYISFLSVKYDIFEPILSFLNTRYTILNLQIALSAELISETEYFNYVALPTSNLVKGYDDLKVSVYYVLSKQEFQQFFEDKYFESTWYEKTSLYSSQNISIRTGILQFLDYQYYFKMAYIKNTLNTDTPYFYYSYKNYRNLYTYFSNLSNEMLDLIFSQIVLQKKQITIISAIISSLLGVTICYYIIVIIKQRQLKTQLLNCYLNLNQGLVNLELDRLKELNYQIVNNQIQNYQFDIRNYDVKLSKQEQKFKKMNQQSVQGFQKKYRKLKAYGAFQFLIVLINQLIYFLIVFITISQIEKYLNKIQKTSQFYQQFSNLGVNVLIIYSQREVIYRSPLISFFNSTDLQFTRSQIYQGLSEISNISTLILEVNQDDYLFDQQSIELFDKINTQSLCEFLPDETQSEAKLICSEVLQGILQKGLVQTINYMHNAIFSESQVSNFTNRSTAQTPVKELEGATFTSQVIKVLVGILLENLTTQINQLTSDFLIVYIILIILDVAISIFILIKFSEFEYNELDILRKGVFVLPQQGLLFDDHLQRELNNLIMKGNLA